MKGKYLAGFLAAVMTLSALAGCGLGNSTETGSQSQAQSDAVSASAAGEQTSDGEGAGDREEYVCKIVCVGDATSEACDAVAQKASEITLEKYNTRIELVRLSYGSFADELNLMLSSGEKLDLFPN